jgi:AraC family transcriptional regulator, regulatory protein of adaptative response / DNA-3-methyladenine glycosylase II
VSWFRVSHDLGYTEPLTPDNLYGHLAETAVPGVEEWHGGAYRRSVTLAHGPALLSLPPPAGGRVPFTALLSDRRDDEEAVAVARFVLDLDADPVAIDDTLRADPVLRPLVEAHPGRRVPRVPDAAEFAVRALLGQQVSTAAARTHAARLVVAYGTPVDDPQGGLTHVFPGPGALSAAEPALPTARKAAFRALVAALRTGELSRAELLALPGIGPWTADSVAMRALGDPDAFLPTDLGVKGAARNLGLPTTPGALTKHAERWRPYRAYAVQYLWATLPHPINVMP